MRSTKNGQGGGGGGTPRSIAGTGGGVNADSAPGIHDGITLATPAGKSIWMNGPVIDQDQQPQAPDAITLVARSVAPGVPPDGRAVLYFTDTGVFRLRGLGDTPQFEFAVGADAALLIAEGGPVLSGSLGATVGAQGATASMAAGTQAVEVTPSQLRLIRGVGQIVAVNLPTVDPHVDGGLWIAPLTRQLMVSAG